MGEELFSGWAPDAPVDDSLMRRFVFCAADRASFLADRLGRPAVRTDAVAAVDLGSTVVFDNFATILQPPSMFDVADALAAIDGLYPPERPYVVMSPWPLGDLTDRGLSLMGHPPFMYRPAGPGSRRSSERRATDLRIVEVASDDDLDAFVTTLCDAYPMPRSERSTFDERMLGGTIRMFLGYDDDRPVATAGTVLDHGLNDVEWVSVMDDCRGRGFGHAITWAATTADPRRPPPSSPATSASASITAWATRRCCASPSGGATLR